MDKTDLKYLKKYIKNKNIYMFWGFDKNDQYSSLKELNAIIKNIAKELANNSIIFYNHAANTICCIHWCRLISIFNCL